jgi:hypothetical protein
MPDTNPLTLDCPDVETFEDDVHYGIADCRRRLRSQRSSLRAQHRPPTGGSNVNSASEVRSYAEIFASVSMSQSSLSRLVDCLLPPAERDESSPAISEEREEAVIT